MANGVFIAPALVLVAFGLVMPFRDFSQEPLTALQIQQKLEVSQRRGTLEMEGGEPFHLVASFEMFAANGKGAQKGTLDVLWENPRRYRRTITFQGATLVEVDNGTQAWRTGRWALDQAVGLAIGAVVQPFLERPTGSYKLGPAPRAQNPNMDCVGTEPMLEGVSPEARLAMTTYCMAQGNHLIRLIARPSDTAIGFNDIEPFGKKFVARTIEVAADGQTVLRMHVDALTAPGDLSGLDAPAAAGAQPLPFHRADQPFSSTEVKRGQLLNAVPSPIFPSTGLRGSVVVKVSVDAAGKVATAEVIGSENQIIKNAALVAVKQWEWRLSYQGDKVVPQETFVRLNFGDYVK